MQIFEALLSPLTWYDCFTSSVPQYYSSTKISLHREYTFNIFCNNELSEIKVNIKGVLFARFLSQSQECELLHEDYGGGPVFQVTHPVQQKIHIKCEKIRKNISRTKMIK